MDLTPERIQELIADLRARGSDRTEIEVKRASGGCPRLPETLCAFGNMPEGGLIVCGLDESADFAAVGVYDRAQLQQGIAAQARTAVVPPVTVSFQEVVVDRADVVVTTVAGLPSADRPCRTGGLAYLRQADGDYVMSEREIAQILARRERPRFDSAPVNGSTVDDLDERLLEKFLDEARASSRRLADATEGQILRWKGLLEPRGERLTLAGLYALGRYPQQFSPSLSITAAVELPRGSEGRTRDLVHLDGPLPELLDQALQWVRRNTRTVMRYGADGHGRDENEIPLVAVRELIANALVHRDLGPHTQGKRVEIRLRDEKLVISSPGGLWGVSRDQLGSPGGKSAVNEFLYDMCKLVRTSGGNRVIEGEGGGIREVRTTLRAAGMRQPAFVDTGVSFTAIVPRHALISREDVEWLADVASGAGLSDMQREILVSMRSGQTWSNSLVREEFRPIDSTEARAALQGLVNAGFATTDGERGSTTYRLAPSLSGSDSENTAPVVSAGTTAPQPDAITANGGPIWAALSGPKKVRELAVGTGLTEQQVRYALNALLNAGLVLRSGGPGNRDTTYSRAT